MSLTEERDFICKEMAALSEIVREVDLRAKITHAYLRDTMLNDDELEVLMRIRFGLEDGEDWP